MSLCEQKNGVPLSRKTLINHARADAGFFRLICELPQQFIEVIYTFCTVSSQAASTFMRCLSFITCSQSVRYPLVVVTKLPVS